MTLFTLEKNKKKLRHVVILYIVITAFIAFFGAVYEQYSRNVQTPYMWFAWVWVLGFGLVPHILLYFLPLKKVPGLLTGCVYNLGVAFITTRSIYIGVTTIANTPNKQWEAIYLIVSLTFLIGGAILYGIGFALDKESKENLDD